MVLLILVWGAGWMLPPGAYFEQGARIVMLPLTGIVLFAYGLLGSVLAAGFFHAASNASMKNFGIYRSRSYMILLIGFLWLFPVPIMTLVLGGSAAGRAVALIITGISLSGIIFARARINLIGDRLEKIYKGSKVAPFEEVESL